MFEINGRWAALSLLLVAVFGLFLWRRRRDVTYLEFSDGAAFIGPPSLRVRLSRLPRWLMVTSWVLMCVALTDPTVLVAAKPDQKPESGREEEFDESVALPTEGIALYFVLDRSGSMRQPTAGYATRIDLLKSLTGQFVASRHDDLIGLIGFARTAEVLTPLTLDHKAVLDKLAKFSAVRYGNEDGTAIGYALFKTVNLIAATKYFSTQLMDDQRPSYDIKSTVVVLVTDGLHYCNALDADHPLRSIGVEEAGQFAQDHRVKLYIINIEPMIRAPMHQHQREALQNAAEESGGRFYIADSGNALRQIYAEIDQLERSILPQKSQVDAKVKLVVLQRDLPDDFRRMSFAGYLIGAAVAFLFAGVVLDSTWLRRL